MRSENDERLEKGTEFDKAKHDTRKEQQQHHQQQ